MVVPIDGWPCRLLVLDICSHSDDYSQVLLTYRADTVDSGDE